MLNSFEEIVENTEETPKKQRRSSSSKIEVRSAWSFPINGEVLIYANDDFRLVPSVDWRRNKAYQMSKSEFEGLPKPQNFDVGVSDEKLWRAGVVNSANATLDHVEQAVRLIDVDARQVFQKI